ncbi:MULTISPECIES: CidA/LrgA family protein [Yersinia]|uniref:CidA/LrgA family protein n=1 Tax=Yersinia TaxID=629 RepID=UPI0011AA9957|nr:MULTISPECIES: CidA/LrgA family protein [Yersinia]MDA5543658.1 CidA/LrgA family protein [Yersinia rochesterensis]MDN0106448.1 CidA/LrgA family protein [Yersinia rochesterensis]MDR5017829.1 CidA/LrgA family protein [Yersinia rochesterensis]UZM76434.1 CidA/LrgA family protein [Yersinia sp. SCPM-O-B-9106 (C-191)]
MRNVTSLCWQYLRAFAIIYLCLWAGKALALLLPITIPGSIIGMLILFALLASQVLPSTWVKPGCHLLIRYMALLFVPIGVGVMQYYDQLTKQFGPIVVSCFVSTLIVMLVVAYSSHYVHRERKVIGSPTHTEEDK